MEITIRTILRHICIVLLLGGYLTSGAFGPGSTLNKVISDDGNSTFTFEHRKESFPEQRNIWGTRRHLTPENRMKIKTDVVLLSGLVPEFKQYHVVVEIPHFELPTSASHYTPRPRDPPLT